MSSECSLVGGRPRALHLVDTSVGWCCENDIERNDQTGGAAGDDP
jgi:hypothetical protein